ncbi:ABC transporter substrate-binding protein [Acidipropionibacterium acidipropionici]|uniref:ABC transporter substrate-binding protein n=1 Tax=Acidipropionibacterium acidipropionici TaxID=1748 RepID=UPI0003F955A9|nr:extracellular solute-binding protein [Acidipropionibacterium acidipropionici]ALN15063.1 ABC transporter substrate-binding protein [Acidipropionibacterium acidipropionici]APZ09186.1 ABC transporter substrate-binding protein [Acidipropionibacterium acidipropionici]
MSTNISRRGLLGLSLGTAATGLLSACGSGTPGQTSSQAAAGKAGATTIEFWHRTFTPVENTWYANIVKKYNAAQSKVQVHDTEVPADAWDQKMKAAQAAGTAPDIYTHSGFIEDAVRNEELHKLNGIVPDDKLKEILPLAQPVSRIGSTYYAYPLLVEAQCVLFWNKDMLKAAGLDPEKGPGTWDELVQMCAKIKPTLKKGQYCIAPAQDADTFAWSTVGQQYNFSGHTALTDDWTRPSISDAGYRNLMTSYKKLWDGGYMPKQALATYLVAQDFGQGKVAFKVSGSWMMSEIGSDYKEMLTKTGVGPFPSASSSIDRTATTLGNFKWVVDAKTKKAEAAGDFLTWAIAGDTSRVVDFFEVTQYTKVPVRKTVQDAVAATDGAAKAPWSKTVTNEIAPKAIPEPTYSWDISLAVGTAMESVMKGAKSFDGAVETAGATIDKVIKRDKLADKAPEK